MRMRVNGESHWFLKHVSGIIVDATAQQFGGRRLLYSRATGSGFLTKNPSRRARKLMKELVWQQT